MDTLAVDPSRMRSPRSVFLSLFFVAAGVVIMLGLSRRDSRQVSKTYIPLVEARWW